MTKEKEIKGKSISTYIHVGARVLNVSRQLRHVRSRHSAPNTLASSSYSDIAFTKSFEPYNDITSPGCESVRTRYDLLRTTGQGALIWSAIRVRHRPRAMHHKLLDFYIFRPRPCFPPFLSQADHHCSYHTPINCSSPSFRQDLAPSKILSDLSFRDAFTRLLRYRFAISFLDRPFESEKLSERGVSYWFLFFFFLNNFLRKIFR